MSYSDLIRKWNDPVLKQVCEPVTPGEDLSELFEVMNLACRKNRGVGLAAPQIGVAKRVVMTLVPTGNSITVRGRFFVNPEIVQHSDGKSVAEEGCLSYPGKLKAIARWTSVTVAYTDRAGQRREEKFYGYAARVLQHEIDHIDGVCRVGDDSPAAEIPRYHAGISPAAIAAIAVMSTGIR